MRVRASPLAKAAMDSRRESGHSTGEWWVARALREIVIKSGVVSE